MPRLTAEQRARARALVERGWDLRSVGEELGVSHETVRRIASAPATPEPPVPPPAAGPLVERLVALAAELESIGSPERAATIRDALAIIAARIEPPEVAEVDPNLPPLDGMRALALSVREAHATAVAVGDARGASANARTAAGLLSIIAKLERQQQDDGDMIHMPRRELAEGRRRYRERVAAIAARPLTCARCGAALRAEIAGVTLPEEPPMIGGAALVPSPGA